MCRGRDIPAFFARKSWSDVAGPFLKDDPYSEQCHEEDSWRFIEKK